ncbi:helix-turn-helix transcriptional regulator [Nocardia jejuensis]|uniref:helix-turn-helix transcriptional regulator n=1 Tax=Nocardia jejuensis TaxID=328049 RepID=UPI00082BF555|nr:AraC family transcriptional regulator [Nocardia jejuensis]
MIEGTIPTRVAALIRTTALNVGVTPAELDAIIPTVDPASLADDLVRVPTEWAWRAWELIDASAGIGSGLLATDIADRRGLYVWDYPFISGPILGDSARNALGVRGVVADPSIGWVVMQNGRLLTVRDTVAIDPDPLLAPLEEFMLSIMLRRVRAATRRYLVPDRVAFSHRASNRYNYLVDEFGTSHIEFGCPCAEITFLDAGTLSTQTTPDLGAMLRHYAEIVLAASNPAPSWRQNLRATITIALREGDLTIDEAAQSMAMSARTLQRRLHEMGTSWRHELESIRYEQASRLMRDTNLPIQSVAARLGYADARTLRRAIRRWTGQGTDEFRRRLHDRNALGTNANVAG